MLAFFYSIVNLSRGFIGNFTGAFINKWFIGISRKNVGELYPTTVSISLVLSLYNIYMCYLIPTQKDIDEQVKQSQQKYGETKSAVLN